ncbi:MAG TPA: hypothetical protein VLE23_19550 [Geminicoccaceae bacterium]|nr:hypothetical protein [Geminicoccaceae bacterium]
MTGRPAFSRSCFSLPTARLLLAGSAALTLIATPAGLTVDHSQLGFAWQTALAKDDGGGPGNGGGQGGSNGGGHGGDHGLGKAHGRGHGSGHGGPGPDTATFDSVDQFRDAVRNGKAFGHGRHDARMDEAKSRYRDALEPPGRTRTQVPASFTRQHGSDLDRRQAYGLAPHETQALIERGWKGPKTHDGFKNHGQRTRTMVELAKRLGYSPRVGALQANFGTPYENGIADLQDRLAEARAAGDEAEVERLEAELEAAIAAAKPAKGPDDSWATADLDVNDDGTVDARDLDALDQAPANEPAS